MLAHAQYCKAGKAVWPSSSGSHKKLRHNRELCALQAMNSIKITFDPSRLGTPHSSLPSSIRPAAPASSFRLFARQSLNSARNSQSRSRKSLERIYPRPLPSYLMPEKQEGTKEA